MGTAATTEPKGLPPAAERVAAGLCWAALLLLFWSAAMWTPLHDWNGARIFPAYLLAAGEPIYPARGAGLITGWIYGPTLPLLLAPATLIPQPTWAMAAAALLHIAVFVAPLLWLLDEGAGRGLAPARRLTLAALAGGILLTLPTTAIRLVFITSDQLAIGLGAAALVVLNKSIQPGAPAPGSARWLAAALGALAVWTKQTEALLPLGQVVFLWWRHSRAEALRHLTRVAAALGLCGLVFTGWFGARELWLNLVWIPTHHPLATGMQALGVRLAWALLYAAPPLALGLWAARRLRGTAPAAADLIRLCLVSGAVLFPPGVMAAAKSGGDENSFHFIYFFAGAAGVGLGALGREWLRTHPRALVAAAAGAILLGAWAIRWQAPVRLLPAPQLDRAVALAATQPGGMLFPRNPLVTWLAERKAYHLEWGVFDQAMAGLPVSHRQFWSAMPPQLSYVVYPLPGKYFFMPLLPSLREEAAAPGLTVYAVEKP